MREGERKIERDEERERERGGGGEEREREREWEEEKSERNHITVLKWLNGHCTFGNVTRPTTCRYVSLPDN